MEKERERNEQIVKQKEENIRKKEIKEKGKQATLAGILS